MEFSEVLRRRRMIRNYDPDRDIPAAIREKILAAALRAPSAGFTQGWGFLVLQNTAERERFWQVSVDTDRPADRWLIGMRRAPLLVVCFSNQDAYLERYAAADKGWTDRDPARWGAPYWDIDTGFAALLMMLAAIDSDLGTCFFGVPPRRIPAIRDAFDVPEQFRPIGVVAIGYPAPDHRSPSLRRGHKPQGDVIHRERW